MEILFLLATLVGSSIVRNTYSVLFPFGSDQGDTLLSANSNYSSNITLDFPIFWPDGQSTQTSIFISRGCLAYIRNKSYLVPKPSYKMDKFYDYSICAFVLSNVCAIIFPSPNFESGSIFYRRISFSNQHRLPEQEELFNNLNQSFSYYAEASFKADSSGSNVNLPGRYIFKIYDKRAKCELQKYCKQINDTYQNKFYVGCSLFSSFASLNLTCEDSQRFYKRTDISYIEFIPSSKSLILNSDLDLNYLGSVTYSKASYIAKTFRLRGLNGFELSDRKRININLIHSVAHPDIYFEESRFDFYYESEKILNLDSKKCNESKLVTIFNSSNYFSEFSDLNLAEKMQYPKRVCPFLFKNINLPRLYLYVSLFEIDSTNYSNLNTLNSSVYSMELSSVLNLNLNRKVFHPQVHSEVFLLRIVGGSIRSIETDLFKSFQTNLNMLYLKIRNTKGFFHSQGIDWIKSINYDIAKIDLDNKSSLNHRYDFKNLFSITLDNNKVSDLELFYPIEYFPYLRYQFLDEDFCLFAQFPHQQLIVLLQISNSMISPETAYSHCSCTLLWISKYVPLFLSPESGFQLKWSLFHNFCDADNKSGNNTFYANYNKCNISSKLEKCNVSSVFKSEHDSYFDLYDLNQIINVAKIYLLYYFGSILSFIGFLSNFIIIITIKYGNYRSKNMHLSKEERQELIHSKDNVYKYKFMNSVFNSLFCALHFFDFLIKCTPTPFDIFLDFDSCFIRDSISHYLESVLKLMSNFSYLQMCICRYILIGNQHFRFIEYLAKIEMKYFSSVTFVVSFELSIILYFQNSFFDNDFLGTNMKYKENWYNMCFWGGYQRDEAKDNLIEKKSHLTVIFVFTVIYDLITYILFCILTLLVDLVTIRKLKQTLKEKSKMSSVDHFKETRKIEVRGLVMIIINGLSNFIFRMPEMLSVVIFSLFASKSYMFKRFCNDFQQCLSFTELSNVFYIFSLSFNLWFYYLFNKNFKKTIQRLNSAIFAYFYKMQAKAQTFF